MAPAWVTQSRRGTAKLREDLKDTSHENGILSRNIKGKPLVDFHTFQVLPMELQILTIQFCCVTHRTIEAKIEGSSTGHGTSLTFAAPRKPVVFFVNKLWQEIAMGFFAFIHGQCGIYSTPGSDTFALSFVEIDSRGLRVPESRDECWPMFIALNSYLSAPSIAQRRAVTPITSTSYEPY
jgi:hypothetical protein